MITAEWLVRTKVSAWDKVSVLSEMIVAAKANEPAKANEANEPAEAHATYDRAPTRGTMVTIRMKSMLILKSLDNFAR